MSKKYLVWKDPDCNGQNIEWIELKKDEFLGLVNQSKDADRFFIRLSGQSADDIVYIETTEDAYRVWKAEKNNEYYLAKQKRKSGFELWSLDTTYVDSGRETFADIIAIDTETVEELAEKEIALKSLKLAMKELPSDEFELIKKLYLSDDDIYTETELAKELGVSQVAVNKKKKKIFKKLKELVLNFEKSK